MRNSVMTIVTFYEKDENKSAQVIAKKSTGNLVFYSLRTFKSVSDILYLGQ